MSQTPPKTTFAHAYIDRHGMPKADTVAATEREATLKVLVGWCGISPDVEWTEESLMVAFEDLNLPGYIGPVMITSVLGHDDSSAAAFIAAIATLTAQKANAQRIARRQRARAERAEAALKRHPATGIGE